MTESTIEQYAASTNGRVHFEDEAATDETPASPRTRSLASTLVPLVIIVAALIVVRRMQAGNYA